MRVTIIISCMLFLSSAIYAQQQRQMEKPSAAIVKTTPNKSGTAVRQQTAAPRQMAVIGSSPVAATPKAQRATVHKPGNGQTRQMVPLNPNQAVTKTN